MIRPDPKKTMTRQKAERIREALWIWRKFDFLTSELLELIPIKPYERELYALISDGIIILIEVMEDETIACSQLEPPELKSN